MNNPNMPLNDPLVRPRNRKLKPTERDENEGKMTETWVPYFTSQNAITTASVRQQTTPVTLSNQTATIGLTAIPAGSLSSGLYRVSYYARVTTASGATSSLEVTIHWTDGGISCSLTSPALTTNTTASVSTGTALVNIDGATPVSYSTTYASTGAPPMAYALYIVLESLNQ
jgi:hypothetical protein